MREPIRDRERLIHIDDALTKLIDGTALKVQIRQYLSEKER
jgi:hypothetical protein